MKKCLGLTPELLFMKSKNMLELGLFSRNSGQSIQKKSTAIQDEVIKLLKVDFIYPVPLTEWVSNIMPVTKKEGTICVCVDYRDLSKACPKDNYPTSLSIKSLMIV